MLGVNVMTEGDKKKKTGPKTGRLKIDGDWESAMGKAVKKKKPKDGWPEHDKDTEKDENKEK